MDFFSVESYDFMTLALSQSNFSKCCNEVGYVKKSQLTDFNVATAKMKL